MYPLCKDCIHHRWRLSTSVCSRTHLPCSQCRHNEMICGEHAKHFSPKFNSIKIHLVNHSIVYGYVWGVLNTK